MADDQQCAVKTAQTRLDNFQRFDVEMVGWLVKDEQQGGADAERTGQPGAQHFAAAQGANDLKCGVSPELEARKGGAAGVFV